MFDAVPPALQTVIKDKIPMVRFAHAEEIAKAVLFLGKRSTNPIWWLSPVFW